MPSGVYERKPEHRKSNGSVHRRYNGPDRSPRFTQREDPFSVRHLQRKLRGAEIRSELLSKSVYYDGLHDDQAANAAQIAELKDLLRQAAA